MWNHPIDGFKYENIAVEGFTLEEVLKLSSTLTQEIIGYQLSTW